MRRLTLVALVASASLVFAACAMPADDPNFTGGENAGGAAAASQDAQTASDAQSAVQAAMAAPTSIGVDAPLSKAPAKGAVIVSVSDGSALDTLIGASMAKAATSLGWTFQEVTGADSAENAPAAFDKALAMNPAGIRISGSYADAIADGLAKAAAAKIPVICTGCATPGAATDATSAAASAPAASAPAASAPAASAPADAGTATGLIADTTLDGSVQNAQWGSLLASYVFFNRNKDEDAGVELFSSPGGGVAAFNTAFADQFAALCRNCSSNEDAIDPTTVTDVAGFVSDTMSTALGRWALIDTGVNATGVQDALASNPALLSPVIVVGRMASAKDISGLSGTAAAPAAGASDAGSAAASAPAAPSAPAASAPAPSGAPASGGADAGSVDLGTPEQAAARQAWIAVSVPILGWRVIDQFARILGGDAPATGPLPSQLLTPANAKDAVLDADGNYIGIKGFEAAFAKLWGLG